MKVYLNNEYMKSIRVPEVKAMETIEYQGKIFVTSID